MSTPFREGQANKKPSKVLYLTAGVPEYLADSLFHGLRQVLGNRVIDYPKNERMYQDYPLKSFRDTYKQFRGFSIYRTLPEVEVCRENISQRIAAGEFDLIIFPYITADFGLFVQLYPVLTYENTAVVDGSDGEAPYPYAGRWWRTRPLWFLPRANRFRYFKRELTARTLLYRLYCLVPESLCRFLPLASNWIPISYSMPIEKITRFVPPKTKLFGRHIVDPEVAAMVPGSTIGYAFEEEADYYADLQSSKFAITTKRAGWDCLRHYEIAANGCVPCFRNLKAKPRTCAPHGLDESNCIIYTNAEDLMSQISNLSTPEYNRLAEGSIAWVLNNSTAIRARQFLAHYPHLES